MSTKILNFRKNKLLQPEYYLNMHYKPETAKYSFGAMNLSEARAWQKKTKKGLARTLGIKYARPIHSEKIEEMDKGRYIREKILLRTNEYSLMPVYIFRPKNVTEPPVVLAFHGHGFGVKEIIGLSESGREREIPYGYQKDFAITLCDKGFAVVAPEILCFGERQCDFSSLKTGPKEPTACIYTATMALHMGTTLLGMRILDSIRLIDYLKTRNDMNWHKLGAMGISGGGMLTFFLACLDSRIRACVISGYYSTFKDSILTGKHCLCNYVPGLGQFGEMYDLVGLIAPRPLFIESGSNDMDFPTNAVKRSVKRAKQIYQLFGSEKNIDTDFFEGGHEISGSGKASNFLKSKII